MQNSRDLEDLIRRIHDAFPSMSTRKDLLCRPHSWWVDERPKLPLLLPKDVVDVLPFVLVDMANSIDTNEFENADQVIYFLDVLADPPELRDRSGDEVIERFADEFLGEEAARFKEMMLSDLPRPPGELTGKSADELRARARQEREASFTEIIPRQAEVIFRWLQYIARTARYVTYETELPRALEYWRRRSGIAE